MAGDILGQMQSNNEPDPSRETRNRTTDDVLKSIDATLKKLLDSVEGGTSQSSARDASRVFRDKQAQSSNKSTSGSKKSSPKNFTDGLEQSLLDAILGPDFQSTLEAIGKGLAKDLGVSLEELPGQLGKSLGDLGINAFKSTDVGSKLFGAIDGFRDKIFGDIGNAFTQGAAKFGGGTASNVVSSILGGSAGQAGAQAGIKAATSVMSTSATSAAGALSGIAASGGTALIAIAAVSAAMLALDKLLEAFGPAIEGTKKLFNEMSDSANRYSASRQAMMERENERLEADIKSIVEEPFKILEDAAQKIYDAWDANLRLINGTQGYSKADLQDLMAVYAERLRSENLSKVIGGTDIIDGLAKVLESGLSGAVAEEFAYQATLLSAAVPTQDFFSYADTYASLAANAIKNGESQADAIEYANEQLQLFASNVLYASRQISGGFSTGLKDAESLFSSAVKIAQASRTGDPSEIAGVLTAVSAITGAIAPDLASSMTDAIVSTATGGNSSELVALRSLAGVNASNTEFLRQLAQNPQKIFSTLFSNLAEMQNMSQDAYMEVAEGLSGVFGISMDAFSRIDFNYLAQAISSMDVNTASLSENIAHLASGETTTTAEQLRMQQINQYMIDEGLAYVLDNEVARSIQEHMWDEQLANEIMEASYAVELKGAALEFLEGIRQTVDNIIGLINPFSWIKKSANLFGTAVESVAQEADIRQLLELGKVGNGNAESLYQLTTRGVNLNLTPDLITLMGGVSAYGITSSARNIITSILEPHNSLLDSYKKGIGAIQAASQYLTTWSLSDSMPSRSTYSWGTLGKNAASVLQSSLLNSADASVVSPYSSSLSSTEDAALAALQKNFSRMIDDSYMGRFLEDENGYYSWKNTAGQFGISNFEESIEKLGYTENDLMNYFQAQQTSAYQKKEQERLVKEEEFWAVSQEMQTTIRDNTVVIIDLFTLANDYLLVLRDDFKAFYADWVSYFIDAEVYRNKFTASDVSKIESAEKDDSKKAIYSLAEVLTSGNKDLLDPTLQTNALLAQILLVVQSIMNQNNTGSTSTILDTMNALATGLITTANI